MLLSRSASHPWRSMAALLLAISMMPLSACSSLKPENTETAPTTTETTTTAPIELPKPIQYETEPKLVISELMARNTVGVTDSKGMFCSWIEIQNLTGEEINLAEYELEFNGKRYPLANTLLAGGGYTLLLANGGKAEGELPFILSSTGTLTLWHGELAACRYEYVNRTYNYSFVTQTGSETQHPTPGYETVKEPDQLIISELMSNNSITPINNQLCDYVELYNSGETPIALADCFLSEDPEKPYDSRLPDKTIQPGEYLVLASETDFPFGLSKDGGLLYITRTDGVVIASVTYDAMSGGQVLTYDRGVIEEASPGYPNTKEGMISAILDRRGLLISEVISSNGSYLKQNGNAYDVVEVWNHSDSPILLSDYYFSDSKKELQRYQLPEVTLEPGAYYTFLCTDTARIAGTAPINISSEGEKIFLSKSDGSVTDALLIPEIPYNVSYGRSITAFLYFTSPTPGKANGNGYATIASPAIPSLTPGEYVGAQTLVLEGEGTIYYTTDGSRPTTQSPVYQNGEEIPLTATTAIRTFSVVNGKVSSPIVTYNYLIDIPDYTLPIVKLAVVNDDVFGENGIYTNPTWDSEKECSVTFFVDGKQEFSVNCGLKIFGGTSRAYEKKSFQLKFKAKYGTSKLRYKVFDDLELAEFDSLVLRSGSQAMMSYRCFINDELVSSVAASSEAMSEVLVQAYRPCNLYINDEYFGVYFIREKIDDDFVAAHYNVSPESVTVINWVKTVKYGTNDQGWGELFESALVTDLTNPEAYRKIADQICLESLIDVYLMRLWSSDNDSGNIRAFRSTEGDGKWRFILFDSDISFENSRKTGRVYYLFKNPQYNRMHGLIRSLLKNDEFRLLFLQRLELHCTETFSQEIATAHIDKIVGEIEHDMQYNVARWPQYHKSVASWKYNIKYMRIFVESSHLDTMRKECITVLGITPEEVRASFGEDYVKYCS